MANRSFSLKRGSVITEGEGTLVLNGEVLKLKKGDSIFIPAQCAEYKLTGEINVILSYV